jgi:hypothetical protein
MDFLHLRKRPIFAPETVLTVEKQRKATPVNISAARPSRKRLAEYQLGADTRAAERVAAQG